MLKKLFWLPYLINWVVCIHDDVIAAVRTNRSYRKVFQQPKMMYAFTLKYMQIFFSKIIYFPMYLIQLKFLKSPMFSTGNDVFIY